jgi:hypothetical protein
MIAMITLEDTHQKAYIPNTMNVRRKIGYPAMVGGWFWLRAILAGVVSGMIGDYLRGALVNRAKTDDFVFEWRYCMPAETFN